VKRFPILPTLITLGNLLFGFLAIAAAIKAQMVPAQFGEHMRFAGWMIFVAMLFDAVDGKIARLYKETSEFGAELDSLCDMVSFGVAPGLMIKALAEHQDYLERAAWATSVFFVMCVALRLARFNVETEESEEAHQDFSGLPSPAAAGFVAAMTILFFKLRGDPPPELAGLAKALEPVMDRLLLLMPVAGAVLGILMVSHLPYTHIISRLTRSREPLPYLVTLGAIIIVVMITRPFSLPVLLGAYVASGLVGWMKRLIAGIFHRGAATPTEQ